MSKKSFLRRSINNIGKRGDTDIFPFPIENALFFDKPEEVVLILEEMDNGFYLKTKHHSLYSKSIVPVGFTGYRWATQIDPFWNALFLAEVLTVAEDIENKRIPAKMGNVFSYRFSYDEKEGGLFNKTSNWVAFYENARKLADDYKYVITTDLSDFYNRVSHVILRDILLNDIQADEHVVERIMDMLRLFSGKQDASGLPVGCNASRILAEAFLSRADKHLKDHDILFCRFVDDIVIFSKTLEGAYGLLHFMSDYFQRELGLSFQKSKTAIMTSAEFRRHTNTLLGAKITENKEGEELLALKIDFDPYSLTADEDLRELRNKVSGSTLIKLLKLECGKTRLNQMVGKQLVRVIPFSGEEYLSEAFRLLADNIEKLFIIFPTVMQIAKKNLGLCNEQTKEVFAKRLLKLFEEKSYVVQSGNDASYGIRVLSILPSDLAKNTIKKIYENCEERYKKDAGLVRLNCIYAMANLKQEDWIIERLGGFDQHPKSERIALIASSALLKGQGVSWWDSVSGSCDSTEHLVRSWAVQKRSENKNWRLPI